MIQVYTGNGKGKTTAALGQVIRAAGNGMKTFFAMFMKDYSYGEIKILEQLSDFVELKQFANDEFVFEKKLPSEELKKEVANGVLECKEKMLSGKYSSGRPVSSSLAVWRDSRGLAGFKITFVPLSLAHRIASVIAPCGSLP